MTIRYVVITKTSDLTDPEAFPRHALVVKCWHCPRGWTLYELYQPVFDLLLSCDQSVVTAAYNDPRIREEGLAVCAEEQKLLAPLYREVADPNRGGVKIFSKTAEYLYYGRGKKNPKWPQKGNSLGWDEARTIRIAGRLVAAMPETVEALETVFKEWVDYMTGLGEITKAGKLTFSGEHFRAICEFAGPCGDAVMALFTMATVTRNITSLEAIGFFHPDDYSTPFRTFGSKTVSYQQAPQT